MVARRSKQVAAVIRADSDHSLRTVFAFGPEAPRRRGEGARQLLVRKEGRCCDCGASAGC